MTTSVIIVTMNRAACVRRCLECLAAQHPRPEQVVVIDASADEETRGVMGEFAWAEYVRTDVGYGHMTKSRNLGLARATGEVVVFLDDDAFAHEGWLGALLESYEDKTVGGVGGRALNNQPGEETTGVESIGRLHANGALTGYFAANPGKTLEVDHLIGCNMSWRRSVLTELGGLRDDYPGTEVREETDIALRVRALGYRLIYEPRAVVTHIGAPQVKGRRFDTRYAYYASRNHAMLLMRNFGAGEGIVWRSGVRELVEALKEAGNRYVAATARVMARVIGLMVGTVAGVWLLVRNGKSPVRLEKTVVMAKPNGVTDGEPVHEGAVVR
jgi:GT2 family glycosyltransferase